MFDVWLVDGLTRTLEGGTGGGLPMRFRRRDASEEEFIWRRWIFYGFVKGNLDR